MVSNLRVVQWLILKSCILGILVQEIQFVAFYLDVYQRFLIMWYYELKSSISWLGHVTAVWRGLKFSTGDFILINFLS